MIKTSKSTTRLLKGGEMMRTLILTLALALVVAGAAVADTSTATIDVYAGWNQIGCPIVPVNLSTDMDIDPELDYTEPYFAWGDDGVGDDLLNGNLQRWDAPYGSMLIYLIDESFGKLLLGDGYFFYATSPATLSYTGLENGIPYEDPYTYVKTKTDMWISLPGFKADSNVAAPNAGGWHLISTPYDNDVPAYDIDGSDIIWKINFTDGNVIKDWMTAVDDQWVSDTMYGFENGSGTQVTYLSETDYSMKKGRGYWIQTFKDDIAMIISAN